ncbi:beta propeller repeat protein [Kribbella monticola]|uniref:sialidase family protein n=1 Tax=Kribbella monticola TaxID=2185285 RepID=UPI000DD3F53E|nr:sialidase family protein [Kribbella monticola]
MSELKELAWTVQESVQPAPFEQLERRGVRRRRRRQVLTGAAAAGATVAVLVVLLPLGGNARSQQPPVVKESDPVVLSKTAEVRSVAMATAGDWSASWADCASQPCRYGATVSRHGSKVTGLGGALPFVALRAGDEPIAVAAPSGAALDSADPTWPETVLLRLDGLRTALHYAKPTADFTTGEILTDRLGGNGELRVLNLQDSTLRQLRPAGLDGARSPVRDNTGRWWVVTGKSTSGSRSDIAWTDDGGKTWAKALLDPANPGAKIAVSPDGRTVVASSWVDGATLEAIGLLRMSTDRGAHWTTVADKPWARGGGPVVFNGSAVMLGQKLSDPTSSLYGISAGRAKPLNGVPDQLDDLAGDERLLYGIQLERPTAQKVAVSTDQGRTWRTFEPR